MLTSFAKQKHKMSEACALTTTFYELSMVRVMLYDVVIDICKCMSKYRVRTNLALSRNSTQKK